MIMKKKRFVILSIFGSLLMSSATFFAVYESQHLSRLEVDAAAHLDNYEPYTYSGNYYDNLSTNLSDGLTGSLRQELTDLIHPTTVPTYGGDVTNGLSYVLQEADEDPLNSSNMIMFYTRNSRTKIVANGDKNWNREHVWPQSLSNNCWGQSKAGADLLHLRPTYKTTNGTRGNNKFGEVSHSDDTLKTYEGMNYGWLSGGIFEPLDSVKGDAARILMYVWTAYYNEYGTRLPNITNVISYQTLLQWHMEDTPDEMEGVRNDYAITSMQKNRNPYVDHPEYGCRVFGASAGSDLERQCLEIYDGSSSNIAPTNISIESSTNSLVVGEQKALTLNVTPSNASKDVTWSSSNSSIISVDQDGVVFAHSVGNATISVVSNLDNNVRDSITFTVKKLDSISLSGTPNKVIYNAGEKFNPIGLTVTATYSDNSRSLVDVNDCKWLDSNTGTEALSEGTTSVTCYYGDASATYVGITVNEAAVPTTMTYNFTDKSWKTSEGDEWTGDDAFGYDGSGRGVQTNGNTGLTVTSPVEFTNVTKITIGTCTNGSGSIALSVGGTSVSTITPSSGSIAAKSLEVNGLSGHVTFKITNSSKSVYIKYITIESSSSSGGDTPEPTIDRIEVSSMPNKTSYTLGERLDLTGIVVQSVDSEGNKADVTSSCEFNPNDGSILNEVGNVTITVSYQGLVTSFSITVSEESGGGDDPNPPVGEATFNKVTSSKNDWTGTYLIVNEEANVALDGSLREIDVANNVIDVTITNSSIEYSENLFASTFTIEAISGGYAVKSNSGFYIGTANSDKNVLETSSSNVTFVHSISMSGENVNLTISSLSRSLRYNSDTDNGNRFRYYKSTSQEAIQLYELIEPTVSPVEEANNFASTFLSAKLCDGGNTAPGVTLWNELEEQFNILSNEAKNIFKTAQVTDGDTVAQAVERYDYIINKYGIDTYSNFMGRNVDLSNVPSIDNFIHENYLIIVGVILTLAILTIFSSYFISRRSRKGQ